MIKIFWIFYIFTGVKGLNMNMLIVEDPKCLKFIRLEN